MQPLHVILVFGAGWIRLQATAAVVADEVIDDGARFRHNPAVVNYHWRLAERVHGLQLRRREASLRITLVFANLVRELQFLQQPENALGTGLVQVVDDDHG